MPAQAKINGTIIAEADKYEVVEGNIYVRRPNQFPISDLTNIEQFPPE